MYRGKQTDRLKTLREKYEDLFGFDPDGEMELEFGDNYKRYVSVLQERVDTKRDLFEVLNIDD